MYLKPICVKCQRFYRPQKNGVFFLESKPRHSRVNPGTASPGDWEPYKVWQGDLWRCPGCGHQLISGAGRDPVSEHYKDDFTSMMEATGAAKYTVNDC